MKRILIIEDDPLIADVYRNKLCANGFAVDVADDGASGLDFFRNRKADLVLLDLMLPQINGLEVLKAIRAQFGPQDLPVLVFTNAFLGGMVQQAWEAGANQVLTEATMTPKMIIDMIKNALNNPPPAAVSRPTSARTGGRNVEFDLQTRQNFLDAESKTLAALWRPLKAFVAGPGNLAHLQEISGKVRSLTATATIAGLQPIAQMSAALEALLSDLLGKPEHVTPSVLLTIAQAIDTLSFLFQYPDALVSKPPAAARILVIDDDEFTRRAVSSALERVNLRVTCVDNPVSALKRRVGTRVDLIFLDIELPGANGLDLCSQLRAMPAYKQTPIVFLSVHADAAHRIESVLCGGDDFISKPFLFMELALKALSYVIRGRVKRAKTVSGSNGSDSASVFSRRDLNALKQAVLSSLG